MNKKIPRLYKNSKDHIYQKLSNVLRCVSLKESSKTEEEIILEAVQKAQEDWKNAEVFFQNVTDPELIDYAIYKLDAALEKYTFLIRLSKQKGIKNRWEVIK